MGIFSSAKPESLMDLLHHNLKDLYDAEQKILETLAQMIEAASNADLKAGLEKHRVETEGQVKRLEQCFAEMDEEPERQACAGIDGIIKEGNKMLADAKGDAALTDVSIIEASQKVEHYEIASYGSAKAMALELGETAVAELLDATLKEEYKADEALTEVAMKDVNPAAK
jgi:ferritin-like metal-binding protein YciE